jgi:hypothetical protein
LAFIDDKDVYGGGHLSFVDNKDVYGSGRFHYGNAVLQIVPPQKSALIRPTLTVALLRSWRLILLALLLSLRNLRFGDAYLQLNPHHAICPAQ